MPYFTFSIKPKIFIIAKPYRLSKKKPLTFFIFYLYVQLITITFNVGITFTNIILHLRVIKCAYRPLSNSINISQSMQECGKFVEMHYCSKCLLYLSLSLSLSLFSIKCSQITSAIVWTNLDVLMKLHFPYHTIVCWVKVYLSFENLEKYIYRILKISLLKHFTYLRFWPNQLKLQRSFSQRKGFLPL